MRGMELKLGEPTRAHFQVGEQPTSAAVSEVPFRLHLWHSSEADDLDIRLNDQSLDDFAPDGANHSATGSRWFECVLNPSRVNRGENRVELLLRKRGDSINEPLVLDAVQLHVRHG